MDSLNMSRVNGLMRMRAWRSLPAGELGHCEDVGPAVWEDGKCYRYFYYLGLTHVLFSFAKHELM